MNNLSLFKNIKENFESLNDIKKSVQITLGPTGKTAIVSNKNDEIQILGNGSYLIKSLDFENKTKNIFLKLIRQASLKTFNISGDGSTTTVLFICEMLKDSFRFLVNGYNAILLSNGFKKIAYFFMEKVNLFAFPLSNQNHLFGLLNTSLGKKINSELLSLFSTSLNEIGRDGLLLVEENISSINEVEIIQGFELEKGFASSYFVNDLKNFEVIYENPYILISLEPISSLQQIEHIIQYVKENNKALVIIAEEINKEIISTLVLNTIKKKLKTVVIKYSSIKFLKTGVLEDLAVLTHSNFLVSKMEKKKFEIEDLGQAEKVIIKKDKSTFIINKFSKVVAKRRINELTRELLNSETEYEKNIFQKRIARLSGNIAKIKIGFSNKYQIEEERKKIENAIIMVKSSLEEGLLIGGGSFYLELKDELKNWAYLNLIGDELFASQIVIKSLNLPFNLLLKNNNIINHKIFEKLSISRYPYVYNLLSKEIEKSTSVLDGAKSIRAILWNSLTLVATILPTE
jgi:chaperonin GroEL